jgi:hypothetical protein
MLPEYLQMQRGLLVGEGIAPVISGVGIKNMLLLSKHSFHSRKDYEENI